MDRNNQLPHRRIHRRQIASPEPENFFEAFPFRPEDDVFPFRQREIPVFEIDVHRLAEYPQGIQIRWVGQGNLTLQESQDILIQEFRHEIHQQMRRLGWDDHDIENDVLIRLGVLVPERGDVFLPPGEDFPWFPLRLLDAERFDLVAERMAQSNATLHFFNLQWHVAINQNSIRRGGAGRKGLPSGFTTKGLAQDSINADPDECCALKAFVYASKKYLHGHIKNIQNQSEKPDAMKEICRDLRQQLNWPLMVTHHRLAELVTLPSTKHIRLVLLFQGSTIGRPYPGENWDHTQPKKNTVYIIYADKHYIGVKQPLQFFKNLPSGRYKYNYTWCHACLTLSYRTHDCPKEDQENRQERKKSKTEKCPKCKLVLTEGHQCKTCPQCSERLVSKHLCGHTYCGHCDTYTPYNGNTPYQNRQLHRCPVYVPEQDSDKKPFAGEGPRGEESAGDTSSQAEEDNNLEEETDGLDPSKEWTVLAYDLECRMTYEREKVYFNENVDKTKQPPDLVVLRRKEKVDHPIHRPNLAVAINIFTKEEMTFSNVEEFIQELISKTDKNFVCIAHNAAGYDSRLIFAALIKMKGLPKRNIFRGTKLVYMMYENIVFLDSMLHLLGSLSKLGKEFDLPPHLLKGHFPHKLNRDGVPNYWPSIPPLEEYEDLRFISTEEDLNELRQWHSEQPQNVPWFLDEELHKYCRQDVIVLSEILKKYHYDIVEICGISPLGIPTSAGLSHRMFLRKYLAPHVESLQKPNMIDGQQCCSTNLNRCVSYDLDKTWVALTKGEYFFARDALRGGRTDVRCPFLSLDAAAIARGEEIRYIDIVSMYPTVQMTEDYPVGAPEIVLYLDDPSGNGSTDKMFCQMHLVDEIKNYSSKNDFPPNAKRIYQQPSIDELKSFFGFIMADVTPPNDLYHPVLIHYDEKRNKSMASLEKIVQSSYRKGHRRTVFTSVEFQTALDVGYKVNWVYEIHHYKKQPSLWKNMLRSLAKLKIQNSGLPEEYTEESYRAAYREMGIVLGEIRNNRAKKNTYKGPLNSAWGKCCENPYHDTHHIFSVHSDHLLEIEVKEQKEMLNICGISPLTEDYTLVRTRPNFDGAPLKTSTTYLPAGVFVPAYGRLMLWKAMHKLGPRVLMHDTDSIIYHHIPDDIYEAPKEGSLLGCWERDGIHKKGKVFEFIGLGPKSYGLAVQSPSGEIFHQIKMKGIGMKLAARAKFQYEDMKDLVLDIIDHLKVPQLNFHYDMQRIEMSTIDFDKIIRKNEPKGVLKEDGFIYPFGHKAVAAKDKGKGVEE